MSRKLLVVLALVVLAGLLLAVLPASAQSSVTYVSYVVQPNDYLSKIAATYCTTWQEIYNLNYAVIGPDPNILQPGIVLTVPNRCGTGAVPPGCTVYDHGPMMYAQGYVYGNVYTVAWGDTWYSVGARFGLPYQNIQAANGYPADAPLYAGAQLIIPGLCGSSTPPSQPTPVPPSSTCSITVYPSKTVYSQPNYNSTLVGVTQPNATFPVNGAWVQGDSGSRWYPIAGFEAPGYVNVYSGEYTLSSNCPG